MATEPLRITIFDDRRGGAPCEAECGLDFCSLAVQQEILERCYERYRDRVDIAYYDLDDPQTREQHREIADRVAAGELELPLLLVNGRPRIAGHFDARMLSDVIEAELELGVG